MKIHLDDNVAYVGIKDTFTVMDTGDKKPVATIMVLAADEIKVEFYKEDGTVARLYKPRIEIIEIEEAPDPRVHPEPSRKEQLIELWKQHRKLTQKGEIVEADKLYRQAFGLEAEIVKEIINIMFEKEGDTDAL